MPPRLARRIGSLCRPCRRHAHSTASTTPSPSPPPPPPPSAGAARLSHRRLVALHGPDSTHFLQGLVTANVRPGLMSGFFAAFLSAQGRVLHDVFIYPAGHSAAFASSLPESVKQKYGAPGSGTPSYMIEVDADGAEALVRHLKRHRLRSKLDIRPLDAQEWGVWSLWDDTSPWTPHSSTAASTETHEAELITGQADVVGLYDARAPGMGRRILLSDAATPATLLSSSFSDESLTREAPLSAYTIRRMLRGVPEGQAELVHDTALPQESNVDFMGGIDFRKGCYVGQELTIRTHHTGIVRKRVLPVQLYTANDDTTTTTSESQLVYSADAPSLADSVHVGTDIVPHRAEPEQEQGEARTRRRPGAGSRSAGRWLAGVGNIGLALVRVETMTDLVLTAEGSRWSAGDAFGLVASSSGSGTGEAAPKARMTVAEAAAARQPLTDESGAPLLVRASVPDWVRNQVRVKTPNARV